MVIVTVANQKGGVGKTTTAANVAAGLASTGRRVLAVDIDAQVNLTYQLGAPLDAPLTTRELLDPAVDAPLGQVITSSPHGVDVLPASEALGEVEVSLAIAVAGQTRLRQVLEVARERYDVAVVDTPPNLGLLTINGLVAADVVLAPVSAEDVGAPQGLARLQRSNALTAPLRDSPPAPVITVVTRWDERRIVASQIDATLREVLDAEPVALIPLSTAIHRAAIDRVPIVVRGPAGARRDAVAAIAHQFGLASAAALRAAERAAHV